MLFEFELVSLEKVYPWGKTDNFSLSWFGFTEGFYRLKVGPDYLFNYSSEFVNYHATLYPGAYHGSLVDYYVVRLWEDLLDILPNLLNPLPSELCQILEMSYQERSAWYDRAADWMDRESDRDPLREDDIYEIFMAATSWIGDRQLDAAYLQHSPRIWLWSTEETVTIAWNNRDLLHEGMQVWSSLQGQYSIPRHQFLEEVYSFNNKLLVEMGERVKRICQRWHRPEILVDFELLQKEQSDRATWLENALKRQPSSPNWEQVFQAIEQIAS